LVEMIFYCLVLGVFAGLLAGLFGIGGGVAIVPSLLALFAWQGFPADSVMVIAIATSLATVVLTSIASMQAHRRMGTIEWPLVRQMAPMIFIGAIIGSWIAHQVPGRLLEGYFALFLIYVGFKMLTTSLGKRRSEGAMRIPYGIGGCVIGLFSSALGIGGGTLTVPYLVHMQRPMQVAVGVSSACGLPIAVASSISYIVLGWNVTASAPGFYGYIYVPAFVGIISTSMFFAPVGAKMAVRLPVEKLQRLFAVLLLLVACGLLL